MSEHFYDTFKCGLNGKVKVKFNVKYEKIVQKRLIALLSFLLAHLSRRLIGELIVYEGIRRPSVIRPFVNILKRHLL